MDGRSDRPTSRRALAIWATAFAGLGLFQLGFLAGTTGASAIQGNPLIAVNDGPELGPSWSRFLSGGPALWAVAKPPSFPSGLVLPTTATGGLVDTPFVEYLSWRRALDVGRFDSNHPNIAPALGALTTPAVVAPSAVTPHAFDPAPQNLPEPGSFVIAFVMSAAALAWWSRSSARRA